MPDSSNNPNTHVGAMAPDASTSPVDQQAETWGIEQTRDMLWIGPMRPEGRKVDEVVVGLTIDSQLTHAAAFRQYRNARLIAAAPDLLAVAQMVVEASELAGFSGPLGDAARAAIAKATGGQHERA